MEAKALEHLQSLILAGAGRQVDGTDVPLIILPTGVTTLSLEPFMKGRTRFRGTLKTSSLKDFVKQADARKNEAGAKGFIDSKNDTELSCTILHNLGDVANPGHADDKSVLQMEPTAAYQAMVQACGRKHEQKDFAEWLEDWSAFLTAQDEEGKEITLSRAITAVRKITVEAMSKAEHQVGDMSATRTAMDSIAATSSEKLPTSFAFKCNPFEGLEERSFTLRLGVLTSNGKPVMAVRIVKREAVLEEIKQEFQRKLDAEIGGFYTLVLGSFSTGN